MQATQSVRRFPLRLYALFSALTSAVIVAMLAALLLAGTAGIWHRTAAQPASVTAVGTGPTDADVLYTESTRGTAPVDAEARADGRGELMP